MQLCFLIVFEFSEFKKCDKKQRKKNSLGLCKNKMHTFFPLLDLIILFDIKKTKKNLKLMFVKHCKFFLLHCDSLFYSRNG